MATRLDTLKELQQQIAAMQEASRPQPPNRRKAWSMTNDIIFKSPAGFAGKPMLANESIARALADSGQPPVRQAAGTPTAGYQPPLAHPVSTSVDPWGYPVDPAIHPADSGNVAPGVPMAKTIYDILGPIGKELREGFDYIVGGDEAGTIPGAAPTPVIQPPTIPPGLDRPNPGQVANPAEIVPAAPAVQAPVDPYQEAIDKLSKYFGSVPVANAAQQKADAYAERERNRTALLAQLAFASGLTSAGGAGWEQVGKGFAAAAGAYDDGFQRYHDALQKSADRYAEDANKAETRRLAIAKAGIDVVEAEKDRTRKTWEETMDSIDKRFGAEMDAATGDFGADPAVIAEIQRRWELARSKGAYVPTDDVRDSIN